MVSLESACGEELRQGQVAHLEPVLDLGPLAANPGSLFEGSGALLGSECGRLRHGETIAPRPGTFTPIFPTQPIEAASSRVSDAAFRLSSSGSGPLTEQPARAAGQHAAGPASGEPLGHIGRPGALGAEPRSQNYPSELGQRKFRGHERRSDDRSHRSGRDVGGAVERGDLPEQHVLHAGPLGRHGLLQATTLRVGAARDYEDTPAVGGRQPEERCQRSEAEIRMGRHGVGRKRACVAEPRIRVRLRRGVDVAPLGVGDHDQSRCARLGDEALQLGHARRPVPFEEGDLRLDHAHRPREPLDAGPTKGAQARWRRR